MRIKLSPVLLSSSLTSEGSELKIRPFFKPAARKLFHEKRETFNTQKLCHKAGPLNKSLCMCNVDNKAALSNYTL